MEKQIPKINDKPQNDCTVDFFNLSRKRINIKIINDAIIKAKTPMPGRGRIYNKQNKFKKPKKIVKKIK